MESALRIKLIFILLVLTTINFIYSGCGSCNCNDGGKSKSKTKCISWSQDKKKTHKDDKNGTPMIVDKNGGGPVKIPEDKDKDKGDEKNNEKLKKEEKNRKNEKIEIVKNKIAEYLNTRDGNRANVSSNWEVEYYNLVGLGEKYILKNGLFTTCIDNKGIDKITKDCTNDDIGNLKINTFGLEIKDKGISYIFVENNKGISIPLMNLVKSLNVLNIKFRHDTSECLRIKTHEKLGKNVRFYLNLGNGVMYRETKDGKYLTKCTKQGNNYDVERGLFYADGKYYRYKDKAMVKCESDYFEVRGGYFNINNFNKDDLDFYIMIEPNL